MNELTIIILNYLFRWYVTMCVINMLIFWNQFKKYHLIYETLKERKWYLCKEQEIIISTPLFTDEMILWRYKKNSFGLTKGIYLYYSPTHYFNSPYSLYWHWKYKKWFREHVDLTELEEKTINL